MTGNIEDEKDIPLGDGDSSVVYKGKTYSINFQRWPSYQTSIWDRTGVPVELMKTLLPVFDVRDGKREASLIKAVQKNNKKNKPILLYNFSGHSSPFAAMPEIMNELSKWVDKFHMVDLADWKCERIYDLIGLFDVSKVIVTIDTSTLHLASASKIKTIAFVNGSYWSGSIPRGNVITEIKYDKAVKQIQKFNLFLGSALNT
jgi:hypothetical protein